MPYCNIKTNVKVEKKKELSKELTRQNRELDHDEH